MTRNTPLARAIQRALALNAVAAAVASIPAFAQDQQEANAPSEMGTVVVTGSRIPQPNLTSISPVTVGRRASSSRSKASRASRT